MKKALILLAGILTCMTACGKKADSAEESSAMEPTVPAMEVTEGETDPPPTNAPFPTADRNAVTFSEGSFSFVQVVADDETSVEGTLSIEDVEGNAMLKFTPSSTTKDNLEDAVQKLSFNVLKLLNADQLESVRSIEMDLYATGDADWFVNDDGESPQVPGWIGGGGGTTTADGKWYGFADFSAADIGEYDLERSDACHVSFKFLLASSGKCWSSDMTEVNLQIMRWGMQNLSSTYIDNIVFYDEEGNSIPLHMGTEEPEEESAEA